MQQGANLIFSTGVSQEKYNTPQKLDHYLMIF